MVAGPTWHGIYKLPLQGKWKEKIKKCYQRKNFKYLLGVVLHPLSASHFAFVTFSKQRNPAYSYKCSSLHSEKNVSSVLTGFVATAVPLPPQSMLWLPFAVIDSVRFRAPAQRILRVLTALVKLQNFVVKDKIL